MSYCAFSSKLVEPVHRKSWDLLGPLVLDVLVLVVVAGLRRSCAAEGREVLDVWSICSRGCRSPVVVEHVLVSKDVLRESSSPMLGSCGAVVGFLALVVLSLLSVSSLGCT